MESTETPWLTGRLDATLFAECGEWVWEQLQEDGYYLAGELVELIMQVERELGVHSGSDLGAIARGVAAELERRGVSGNPATIGPELVLAVLQWEDDFLGFAGIPRAES